MPEKIKEKGCDWTGCGRQRITVTMDMYHDSGVFRRHVKVCSLAHAAAFCVAYADREEAGWDTKVPNKANHKEIESIVDEMIEDHKYRKE
jgi:hypothetical protein